MEIYNANASYKAYTEMMGTKIACLFYPYYDYEFIISTGPDVVSPGVILDYMNFESIPHGMVMEGVNVGTNQALIEKGTSTITGNGNTYRTGAITFLSPFLEAPNVIIAPYDSLYSYGISNKTKDGCNVTLRHVNATTWTGSITFDWVAYGEAAYPFAPVMFSGGQ